MAVLHMCCMRLAAHTFPELLITFSKERINTMKIHFAYYNQYKNGIDIAFADNTLLFLSCAEAEKNLHTTPNSQRHIDNLAIDELLKYCTLTLNIQHLKILDCIYSHLM